MPPPAINNDLSLMIQLISGGNASHNGHVGDEEFFTSQPIGFLAHY